MTKITPSTNFEKIAAMNESIQNLHSSLYPEVFKPYHKSDIEKAFQNMLAQPNCFAFIAENNGQAVGYILCFIHKKNENAFQFERTILYIDQLYIDPNFRRQKIGNQFIEKAIALAKEHQIKTVQLDHWSLNDGARSFFGSLGFRYFQERMEINV